jgi:hypothetical protein
MRSWLDVQDGVPCLLGHPGQGPVAGDARVVDDDVDSAVSRVEVPDQLARRVGVGDVEL